MLLAIVEAGPNWPELQVLTLSGRWGGGGGATGGGAGGALRGALGRTGSESDASAPSSFKRRADAGVAAAAALSLEAPRHLQRVSARASSAADGGDGQQGSPLRSPSHLARGSGGGVGFPLSPEAAAALAQGPVPAARAFLECAGEVWPELRALELPALGRATVFEADHERLEEMAWRAAPRLTALNFGRHLRPL